jgi:hypothetical protein
MAENEDQMLFSCVECGSKDFIYPNQPPKDDDIIKCAGCQREIGRFDVIREAIISAGKAEIDKMTVKTLGKKPTWK